MLLEFIECVRTSLKPRSNLESDCAVTRLVLVAQESIKQNKLIEIGG